MKQVSRTPAFNLKVVVQETGIKPDTLRAWERRYDLPQPSRTSGGHRLYSQYDIEIVKWLIEKQGEGLSISRAVELWNRLIAEGREPLQEQRQAERADAAVDPVVSGPALAELSEAWVAACMDYDEQRAESLLTKAFALYPPEVVCVNVMQDGIAKLGQMWYDDEASVQQEHFASALAMRRLNSLLAAAPQPTRNGRILLACPPEEHHTFVPLMLTLMLRYQGWDVLYLGANVPQNRFESTLSRVKPHLIILTAQQLYTASTLYDLYWSVDSENADLAFGGLIFINTPSLRQRIPGHFLGESLEEAVETVEHLLTNQTKAPVTVTPHPIYGEALSEFRLQQALIERDVWQTMEGKGASYEHVVNANYHMARDISAALTLGDMEYLGPEVDWVEKLLINYKFPSNVLGRFLAAYAAAAGKFIRQDNSPLLAWLDRITNQQVLSAVAGNGHSNGRSRQDKNLA